MTSVTRKRAVVEQHHAIDRRRIGRRRIDAAVLHALAGREVDAGDLLHLAAGDVGTAVADRPDHVRRIVRAAPGAGADADSEVERLAAFEGELADAQQRVVAGVDSLAWMSFGGGRAGDQRCREQVRPGRKRGNDSIGASWNERVADDRRPRHNRFDDSSMTV